ncbi:MAG: ABC transporter substrate-binding protein [bacterium]|nr:ABC transporter substrate-binding protein [bacterium]
MTYPSRDQLRYTFRLFSKRERLVFVILIIAAVIGFVGALDKINQKVSNLMPAGGGTWREGIVGSPHFINPLLAISDPDRDLASLIYSGLLRPDGKGALISDVAERYEISPDGLSYTFTIKPEASFHDGEPLRADDIIFTVELAKNPVLKSPARANWEGVGVEKIDDRTVRFVLKRPYAPLLENLTLGILPKHVWKDIPPEQMSLSEFNINPVGSGPFKVAEVSRKSSGLITSYTLKPFQDYLLGRPYLKKLIFYFYPTEVELLGAYERKIIDAVGALSPQYIKKIMRKDGQVQTLTLPRVFGVFFNQNEKSLFAEKPVREALSLATDKKEVLEEVLQGYGEILNSPVPPGTFGALEENEGAAYNLKAAEALLEKGGWRKSAETGIYEKVENKKVTKQLIFALATSNSPDLIRAADVLRKNWETLGANVEVRVFEIGDLSQNVIRPRKYDALLFGEVVGRDPDPFAFWHSSQRNDPGQNIALYTNRKVDKILEEARTLSSPEERRKKYEEFQKEVAKDSPAIFLYSPYYLYLVPLELKDFVTEHIVLPSERFSNSYLWHFETRYVWKIFKKGR